MILEAATELFLESGYETASLEAIASRAAVSKVTVYKHFGTKSTLYREAMTRWLANLRCEINVSRAPQVHTGELIDFGFELQKVVSSPAFVTAERRIAGSQAHSTELGKAFLKSTWSRFHAALVALLADLQDVQLIVVADLSLAADQLLSMFRGLGDLERRFGVQESEELAKERTVAATKTFLAAYGSRALQEESCTGAVCNRVARAELGG